MSLRTGARCAACGTMRSPGELLAVTRVESGAMRYVCRPKVDGRCFGSVGSAAAESIALADSAGARLVDRALMNEPAWAGQLPGGGADGFLSPSAPAALMGGSDE